MPLYRDQSFPIVSSQQFLVHLEAYPDNEKSLTIHFKAMIYKSQHQKLLKESKLLNPSAQLVGLVNQLKAIANSLVELIIYT
jgi:hypothetical protein